MEKKNALFSSVAKSCGFEEVHELHQRDIEAENSVFAVIDRVIEKFVTNDVLFVFDVVSRAPRKHHVVHALKRIARDLWVLLDDVEILEEGTFPMEVAEVLNGLLIAQNF